MNKDSLKSSRLVLKSWQNCIDNQNILWKKILEDEVSEQAFRQACKNGHVKMAKILIQKSNELNIEVDEMRAFIHNISCLLLISLLLNKTMV